MSHGGYSGYIPESRKIWPAKNPGSKNRDQKFQSAGSSVVYDDDKNIDLINRGRTSVSGDQSLALNKSCYKVPDRRGVMAAREDTKMAKERRRFVHGSANRAEYPNFWKEKSDILNRKPEAYRVQFDMKAINGLIDIAEASRIFQDINAGSATSTQLPEHYNRIFEEALLALPTDTVSWEDFSGLISMVLSRLGELKIGPAEPSKLYQANLPEKVVTALTEESRYSTDLGRQGELPHKRPLLTTYGGQASTTQDLMVGTNKQSNQIPGYSGHMPKSGGPNLQPERQDLKKSVKGTFNTNLPGYTGHWPIEGVRGRFDGIAKTTATTSGAAAAQAAALAAGEF